MSNEPTPLHSTSQSQVIPGPLWDKIKSCLIELHTRDILATNGATNSPWNQAVIEIARSIPDFRETLLRHGSAVIQQHQHKLDSFERLKEILTRAEQGQEPTAEEMVFVEEQAKQILS